MGLNVLQQAILDGRVEDARDIALAHPVLLNSETEVGTSIPNLARATGRVGTLVAMLRVDKTTSPSVLESRCLLRDLIAEISELVACAGWLQGVEFILWSIAVTRTPLSCLIGAWGFDRLPNAVFEDLQWLADLSGGWWHWDDGVAEEGFLGTRRLAGVLFGWNARVTPHLRPGSRRASRASWRAWRARTRIIGRGVGDRPRVAVRVRARVEAGERREGIHRVRARAGDAGVALGQGERHQRGDERRRADVLGEQDEPLPHPPFRACFAGHIARDEERARVRVDFGRLPRDPVDEGKKKLTDFDHRQAAELLFARRVAGKSALDRVALGVFDAEQGMEVARREEARETVVAGRDLLFERGSQQGARVGEDSVDRVGVNRGALDEIGAGAWPSRRPRPFNETRTASTRASRPAEADESEALTVAAAVLGTISRKRRSTGSHAKETTELGAGRGRARSF